MFDSIHQAKRREITPYENNNVITLALILLFTKFVIYSYNEDGNDTVSFHCHLNYNFASVYIPHSIFEAHVTLFNFT